MSKQHATAPSYERAQRPHAQALSRAERHCVVPYCPRRPKLVPLPLFEDRRVWVCDGHRGALMTGSMRALVAHA